MKCGSGSKKIVRPTGANTNFQYACGYTEEFKSVTEAAVTTPDTKTVPEVVILSMTLDAGDYYFDFSCGGYNNSEIHHPSVIIRGWLDFGLGTVLPVENSDRSDLMIEVAPKGGYSFFMLRSQSGVFHVANNGTVLSICYVGSNQYTDVDLYNKILNVFKVTNFSSINLL